MLPKTTGPASGLGAAALLRLARTPLARLRLVIVGLLIAAAVLTTAEAVLAQIALPRIRAVDLTVDAAIAHRLGQDATARTLWPAPGPIIAFEVVATALTLAVVWWAGSPGAARFVAAIVAAIGTRVTRSPDPSRG